MQIYLIRHTTPVVEPGVCYGQSDVPLATSFDDEWEIVKRTLPQSVSTIYTSPLHRCRALSKKIAEHYNIEDTVDERLMEMNFGFWEMKKWKDIHPAALQHWMNHYQCERCPQGESYNDVKQRLKSFLHELPNENATYLLVTHAGIIKCFHDILMQTDTMQVSIGYGEYYHFQGTRAKLIET